MAKLENPADDDELLASINIIPFVDIVLVLLVIFMLTSATIMKASLKVDLPKAASGGSRVESTINLVYTRDLKILLNGKELPSLAEAAAFVRQEATANPKTQAVIAADKAVEYGKVVELIDLVKQNGITAFALDIEKGAAPAIPAAPAAEPAAPVAPPGGAP
jgi:biopolymer transport protein ExbD